MIREEGRISLESTVSSLITTRDPQPVREFFISRGVAVDQATALTSMLIGLMEIRDRAYISSEASEYLMNYLLVSHADVVRIFCMFSTNVVMTLFVYAASLDIKVSEWKAWIASHPQCEDYVEEAFYTRCVAQKIFPGIVEVENTQCCNGTVIYPGHYDPRMFAAIVLGACGAPLEIIDDLRNYFNDNTLVTGALRSLHTSVAQSPELIMEYESARSNTVQTIIRPIAIRVAGIPTPAICPVAICEQSIPLTPIADNNHCVPIMSKGNVPARKLHIVRRCNREPATAAEVSLPLREAEKPRHKMSCTAHVHASYHAPQQKRVEICAS